MAVTDGGDCWSSAQEVESSSAASPACSSAFDDQWRLLAFRIGRHIPRLARLFIIFDFRASVRNIWIREGSLEDALGHAGWQWMQCKGQTQILQFVHYSVTVRWRIVPVSSGLANPPLDNCNCRVQSDSDEAALSSPLSEKKKVCKHQSYAKRCTLRAPRHKTASLIIPEPPTDQTVQ